MKCYLISLIILLFLTHSCSPQRTNVKIEEHDLSKRDNKLSKIDNELKQPTAHPTKINKSKTNGRKAKSKIIKNKTYNKKQKIKPSKDITTSNKITTNKQADKLPTKQIKIENIRIISKSQTIESTKQNDKSIIQTQNKQIPKSKIAIKPSDKTNIKKKNKNDEAKDNESDDDDDESDDETPNSEDNKAKITLALKKLDQKYNKLFQRESETSLSSDYPFTENDSTPIEEKVTKLRSKFTGKSTNLDTKYLSIYNKLGYSIKIPAHFKQQLNDPYLWKLSSTKDSIYEIQIIIGTSFDKNIKLNEIIDKIKETYNKISKIKWKKQKSLDSSKIQATKSAEGIEIKAIKKTKYYHNIFNIQVLRSINKEKVVFIISIFSLKVNNNNFYKLLNNQKTEIKKIYSSFTFF